MRRWRGKVSVEEDGHSDRRLRDGGQSRHGHGTDSGGLIDDTFASYAWLYIGAWGMGLGAFLMAWSFRPFPKVRLRQCRRDPRRAWMTH
jgi:hypothetical protein